MVEGHPELASRTLAESQVKRDHAPDLQEKCCDAAIADGNPEICPKRRQSYLEVFEWLKS